ncbi:methyltransferase domain-containing protein [Sphingobium sufflavum]|uniref:class I SAM-dependent methyltransferase n=1 Tax=Sphingobium sufflavum TaxID=1129547 RepID=UPI001F2DB443|nr:class I SAM-dependent methyltransferase [Sphingobium sufflavum]MCE7795618.1 methyltransferase domain-containing protein [Sphingobium sufflavum]
MTDIASCRVCGSALGEPAYCAAAPALTSIMTTLDSETVVHVCPRCSHAQCPNMPDIQAFYDTEYRISLEADDHDQLFAVDAQGQPLYRTDHQAAISLRMLDLSPGALILDYGAAKSDTLRKMVGQRPDIVPHVFDVSSDYAFAWDGWVAPDHQATYTIDAGWHGRFDAVMSHFAIEHVAEPMAFLAQIRAVLKPGGRLLLSMPDVQGNPGDMIVIDHLNHFTAPSIRHALEASGFAVDVLNDTDFPGAFFVSATACNGGATEPVPGVAEAVGRNDEICRFWEKAHGLLKQARDRAAGQRCAIYGAGFYGSWIAQQLEGTVEIAAFLDLNPNLQGREHLGVPVLNPAALDEGVRTIFVGLNPLKARAIIEGMPLFRGRDLEFVWLD